MRLIAVGRLGVGPERQLFEDYAKRLRPALQVVEIPEARAGTADEGRRREAAAIGRALGGATAVIALDRLGMALDSETFAARLAPGTTLVIGGPDGLHDSILARAAWRWALGPQTWPHRLVRVMLAEQLYRAQSIQAGHPYHR